MSLMRAAIFDLDGVITSTDEFHYRAWKRLFDGLGIRFGPEENEKIKGVGRRESFEAIAGTEYAEEAIGRFLRGKNGYYVELLRANKLSPLPGIVSLLDQIDALGTMRKAIASSSKNAVPILDNLGMRSRFEVVVDGTMCRNSKPAPDLFRAAARRLGVAPGCCVVIEDAQAGIDGATNAAMKSIGIGRQLKDADIILSSTAELTLEILQEVRLGPSMTTGCR
jgi:beta-phosphoglucomutase